MKDPKDMTKEELLEVVERQRNVVGRLRGAVLQAASWLDHISDDRDEDVIPCGKVRAKLLRDALKDRPGDPTARP